MKYWALLIAGAVSPYLFDDTLPLRAGLAVWLLLVMVFSTAMFVPAVKCLPSVKYLSKPVMRRISLYLIVFAGSFLFATANLQDRLNQRLPLSMDKEKLCLSGAIRGLPVRGGDYLRFRFQVAREPGCAGVDRAEHNASHELVQALAGQFINVYWHQNNAPESGLPMLHPGEHWKLELQLRTNRAAVNFVGTDNERWSFASGDAARGFVVSGARDIHRPVDRFNPDGWREAALNKIKTVAGDVPALGMIAALAIADRRELNANDREVLAATGTGHLLAISGLHIGLAAVMGFFLGRLLLLLFSAGMRLRLAISLPWICSWWAALAYSVLAGFGVSTQRALIMLSVAVVMMLCRRKIHPASAWLVAMGVVLLADPFAPLRVGFWFSFLAVAVLVMMFTPRFGVMPIWKKMLIAQAGISLTMAPLGMYFFQQSSMPGLLANLVAIPVVSSISVPFILMGLVVMWLPGPLGGWLFYVAGLSLHWLFVFLTYLATWQPDFMIDSTSPPLAAVLLAMLGALLLIMPRGMPGRAAGVLLILPIFLPPTNPLANGVSQVDVLDVGQGLAVLVGTENYLMVYDTGPGSSLSDGQRWDTVKGTIQPAIARRTIAPDLIVASHADLDHAGGLNSLRGLWPQARVMASLPQHNDGVEPCKAGAVWETRGLAFQVLHPAQGLPYLGNDSSCVISVQGADVSLLLTGDISKAVEQRLVGQSVAAHQIMLVSHHGSASSSTQSFIAAVQPELAVNSAAINNRFDFPRVEVLERFNRAGVKVLNTADCGGLRISSSPQSEFEVKSARLQRDAIWRFKASDFCP